MAKQRYGWRPDLPDYRDMMYSAISAPTISRQLPPVVDLSPNCPPVVAQGNLGSCTANAWASAHMYEQIKQKQPSPFYPSRLFIYYNERVMENTVEYDSGASIRVGVKTLVKQGACEEHYWPYRPNMFTKRPPSVAYTSALHHQVLRYLSVNNTSINDIRSCLADQHPIVFGFTVYESFESDIVDKTGEASMPGENDGALGGHAVMMVGYDDNKKRVKCLNSWGDKWGNKGYFTLPYEYVTKKQLAADFWTLRLIED